MPFDARSWPRVPKQEFGKKPLYVGENLTSEDEDVLAQLGWKVVDVRLLPNDTDADRAMAVKSWLEGFRQGSIEVTPRRLEAIELEAKVYKLLTQKESLALDTKGALTDDAFELLAGMSTNRTTFNLGELTEKMAKKKGRKK